MHPDIDLRVQLLPAKTNAYRVIHSEGDFLPGLIVDRYADALVTQFQTAGMEAQREIEADRRREIRHKEKVLRIIVR